MITKALKPEANHLSYPQNKDIQHSPLTHKFSEYKNSLKQVLLSKGCSRIFKSLNKEIFLDIQIEPITSVKLIVEFSNNGYEFKNFFGTKEFTITKSAQYNFKLTGNIVFSRIHWLLGEGQINLLFTE